MSLGAVVLHHRFWPEIRPTLDALLAQDPPPDAVTIVDNGSDPTDLQEMGAAYPEADIRPMPANLGYAAGMNTGIEALIDRGIEQVLLLTHECILEPGALAALVSALEADRRRGAVGPLLLRRTDPETVYSAGGIIDERTWDTVHVGGRQPAASWRGRTERRVDWLDGSCVLLRTEAILSAGPLPTRYFMYFEDAEYGWRLAEHGWEVWCVPAAVARQQPGRKAVREWVRNRLLFLHATAPRQMLLREVLRLIWRIVRRSPPGPYPSSLGWRDVAAGILGAVVGRTGSRRGEAGNS